MEGENVNSVTAEDPTTFSAIINGLKERVKVGEETLDEAKDILVRLKGFGALEKEDKELSPIETRTMPDQMKGLVAESFQQNMELKNVLGEIHSMIF